MPRGERDGLVQRITLICVVNSRLQSRANMTSKALDLLHSAARYTQVLTFTIKHDDMRQNMGCQRTTTSSTLVPKTHELPLSLVTFSAYEHMKDFKPTNTIERGMTQSWLLSLSASYILHNCAIHVWGCFSYPITWTDLPLEGLRSLVMSTK